MVTTFICSADSHTHGIWQLLDSVSKANLDVRLAELEHPSLKKMQTFCSGGVLIYVHPCFYRVIKLRLPLDVGGLSRDGWVITELGILTPEDFQLIVDTE